MFSIKHWIGTGAQYKPPAAFWEFNLYDGFFVNIFIKIIKYFMKGFEAQVGYWNEGVTR